MNEAFEVSFNSPQCGWMSIGFSDGVTDFRTTTAHAPYTGALAELLTILTALADRSSGRDFFILKWNRDPEAYDFHFRREPDRFILEIYEYPTGDRDEPSSLVYRFVGEPVSSLAAFERTFDQLYADRDTDEFEFNWRGPFPYEEYRKFKESLSQG